MRPRPYLLMVMALAVGVAVTIVVPGARGPGVQASRLAPVMLEPGGPVLVKTLFLPVIVRDRFPIAGPSVPSKSPAYPFPRSLPIVVRGSSPALSPEIPAPLPTTASTPNIMAPTPGAPCNEKGVVTARDGKFWLNGREFKFVGVNANFLMDAKDDDVDRTLRYLASGCGTSVVRVFVTDWGPSPESKSVEDEARNDARQVEKIRSILKKGSQYNLKFIIVLDDTVGHMRDGQFIGSKSTAWYDGGYQGNYPEGSYKRHVERMVRALKDDFRNEIFAWELLNEPHCEYPINKLGGRFDGDYDENCPQALLKFVREMSAYIKRLDPVHMVITGSTGHDQYGISPLRRNRYRTNDGEESWDFGYKVIHELPTVDALTVHHYGEYHPGSPGDTVASALSIARSLNKPFFIEESGVNVPGCPAYQCPWGCEGDYKKRAGIIQDFMEAMFKGGAKGFLLWEFSVYPGCSEYSFFRGEALCDLLEKQSEELCRSR